MKNNNNIQLTKRHICAMCRASTDNCGVSKCCNSCYELCGGMQVCVLNTEKPPFPDQIDRWNTWLNLIQNPGFSDLKHLFELVT